MPYCGLSRITKAEHDDFFLMKAVEFVCAMIAVRLVSRRFLLSRLFLTFCRFCSVVAQ